MSVCSVCIANYNGVGVIDDCIRSVLEQNCAFRYEIIVHDDASTDGSADYIAERYPSVQLIRSDHNVGYCISNNRMAEIARGRFLLLLNNDAALFPDALQTLYEEASRQGRPAILTLPQYDAASGALVDRGLRLDLFLNPVPNLDLARTEVSTVHGACLWVEKDLWIGIGGFPEWFHMLAEDLYLCCVARLRGTKVMVPMRSGYRHRIGYSIGGGKVQSDGRLLSSFKRRCLSERNKNFVMVICYPLASLLSIVPVHILLLLAEGMVLALRHLDIAIFTHVYLSSIRAAWDHRWTLIRHRRTLQRCRTVTAWRFFSTFTLFPQKFRLLLRHGLPQIIR